MSNFFFKDNNRGKYLWHEATNQCNIDKNKIPSFIQDIAEKSLVELKNEFPNILVFPTSFNIHNDDIHQSPIFNLYSSYKLETYNLMGFIGREGEKLTIGSRFDEGEKKQYFMQYMLQKVFSINLVNLNTQAANENIWDFLLMYMFPYYLNKALNQGLYKEYRKVKHNNANVKGTIDIARHIRQNIPFAGKVAYNTREFSFDNSTTQLIRHTIEYITSKNHTNALRNSSDTIDSVKLIRASTPTYNIRERLSVIQNNYKRVNHPFYTEYEELRVICQKILHQDGLSMQDSKEKVHGLLFDGAWLWEEYLNTILKPLGYLHPENNKRKNAIYLFENNKYERYPDFYKKVDDDKSIVLDAKYKHLEWSSIDRNDMHQVISYMHVLKANEGWLLYPYSENITNNVGILNGHGGTFQKYGMKVPKKVKDFEEFKNIIETEENTIKKVF